MGSYVYFLKSKNKSNWSYVGSTSNIEQRIKDHNSGKTQSTKAYRPLYIAYKESCDNSHDAYQRELYFKTAKGRREKAKIINTIENSEIV